MKTLFLSRFVSWVGVNVSCCVHHLTLSILLRSGQEFEEQLEQKERAIDAVKEELTTMQSQIEVLQRKHSKEVSQLSAEKVNMSIISSCALISTYPYILFKFTGKSATGCRITSDENNQHQG